jgi:diguanylate cyclase (GGDEF)-like protein
MSYNDSFKDLRKEIIDCLDRDTDENRLIAELKALIEKHGAAACQVLLHVLTSLSLSEEEASSCWTDILANRDRLCEAMSREVGLRTAICDYFTSVRKSLKNPMVVELHIFEKTLKSSYYDGLTNLFNRTYFDAVLEREISLAKRYQTDVSLLFFDIDDFKQINDTCGHQAGDTALVQLAEIILSEKRTGDIAARYGGEEIVIILPHTNNVEALTLGERIRRRVATTPLCCDEKDILFTVSGGLVSYPTDADDAASLVKYADSAMYRAKGSGKNNISFFSRDKRRYLRVDYRQPIMVRELGFDGRNTQEGRSRNICLGGLLFETNTAFPLGTKLQIKLPMNREALLVIGNVVRVEEFGPTSFEIGVAFSFQEMDKLARKEITRFLDQQSHQGGIRPTES